MHADKYYRYEQNGSKITFDMPDMDSGLADVALEMEMTVEGDNLVCDFSAEITYSGEPASVSSEPQSFRGTAECEYDGAFDPSGYEVTDMGFGGTPSEDDEVAGVYVLDYLETGEGGTLVPASGSTAIGLVKTDMVCAGAAYFYIKDKLNAQTWANLLACAKKLC